MFKAKLIEDNKYYKFRRYKYLLVFPTMFIIGFSSNIFSFPAWLAILIMFLVVPLVLFYNHRNENKLNSNLGETMLEIDEEEIRIKSKKGPQIEKINLAEVDKLVVKKEYGFPEDSILDKKEINQNYLVVKQANSNKRIDFVVDSFYMFKQLDKLIAKWELKGYNVERSI